jgi:8-oxo-dGTP pyrophosphatase MutT (NUDIX family)
MTEQARQPSGEALAERLTAAERERRWPNVRPKDAATLIIIDRTGRDPKVLMGRRHHGHRFMPGKFVFPGGRIEAGDAGAWEAAVREAQEEIGLEPSAVEVVGALPPVSTFVTSYKVHPFVGLIPERLELRPNPAEVEAVLRLSLDDLAAGYGKRRVVRRGMPFRGDTYVVDGHLIWGATARILAELLRRLGR